MCVGNLYEGACVGSQDRLWQSVLSLITGCQSLWQAPFLYSQGLLALLVSSDTLLLPPSSVLVSLACTCLWLYYSSGR